MGFRWPDGVGNVEHDGDDIRIQISMPTDEHGFLGRKCPSCSQLFRIDADAYQGLGDDAELRCVYCGHNDEHSAFITDQQLNRAMRPIGDWAEQSFNQMLSDTFGKVPKSRSRSGIGIEITYRSDPFYPQPLPGINEEELVRIRTCTSCGMRYAVFGEHRYCPVCGPLSAEVVAADALDAETSRLDALNLVPPEEVRELREQGVFNRIWVDTLENLVTIVETLARTVFNAAVSDATSRLKSKGNVFQRLDDLADLFVDAGYPDVRTLVSEGVWLRLQESWATRHVFTHNDGVIDDKFVSKVRGSAKLCQRARVTEPMCRQAITEVRALCAVIAGFTAHSAPPS
jgi:Zn ribbon nucleic-acid-binding protein